ncbi:MAG: HEPN domain-containing protein [bacterium]
MAINPEEWLKQCDYDLSTAEYMFRGKRYFYAVFMCHLSIEKALKGLFQKRLKDVPPKTHNLIYLINKLDIKTSEDIGRFLVKLNQTSVVTRYPEDIAKLQKDYTQSIVKETFIKTKETIKWIKSQYHP